ncbi:restriction endonuclease subunit S [Phascolarctobacterium sp.]|uniref:restriction endonuclease subunit S n=1 Tax=Phascolarctobacterium sp. TaxID=2049039 RepID=UPI0025D68829|nr:restriction endonuclease subunit S [Phascolarctobacterium sp.]
MAKVRLGDYVRIRTGKLDANAADQNGKYPFFTCSIVPLCINTYSYDCECVLVAGNGDLNVKYYNGKFDAYQRTYIVESLDNKLLSVPYLYRFMDKYIETLRNISIGGVIKYIKLGNLTEASINLPTISKQNEIVDVLSVVDNLIKGVEQQLADLDILVKSRFIEMFGTFPDNPKGWECCTIRDIVKEVRYGSSRPAVEGGQYPYLRMNNITYEGTLDLSEIKYIDVPEKELEKCTVRKGDVLFNRTNSKELVGKTCLYDRDESMVLAGFIIRVRVNDKVVPEFLVAFLNMDFSKKMLFNKCKAAIGQANINAQELQNIEIYLPHLALQKEFVSLKYQVDKSKFVITAKFQ